MLRSPPRSAKTDRSRGIDSVNGYTRQSKNEVVHVNDDRSDAGLVEVRMMENCLKENGNILNTLSELGEPKHNGHRYINVTFRSHERIEVDGLMFDKCRVITDPQSDSNGKKAYA